MRCLIILLLALPVQKCVVKELDANESCPVEEYYNVYGVEIYHCYR